MLSGSKLVQSRYEAGSKPVEAGFKPGSIMEFGFEPVCGQLRTS